MGINGKIAAALGKKLWTTDLFIPQYRCGEIGAWRIEEGGQLINDRGYYSGLCLVEMLPSLARKVKSKESTELDHWETWMSLTPHEIESQELGCIHAYKQVLILGLGMGWVAANIAVNPRVTKVTVVELDPDVIELFALSGAYESLPRSARQKITIVNADALTWRPEHAETVDFLYADIWLHLAEPATLSQVRKMQCNIQADKIYYWGQEIAINTAARRYVADGESLTADAVHRAITEVIQLPLLVADDRDYHRMIEQVIRNRIERRLTIEVGVA